MNHTYTIDLVVHGDSAEVRDALASMLRAGELQAALDMRDGKPILVESAVVRSNPDRLAQLERLVDAGRALTPGDLFRRGETVAFWRVLRETIDDSAPTKKNAVRYDNNGKVTP